MADPEGIDDDHRLSGRRDIPAGSIGHLELVATAMPDSEVCAPASIGDDAGDRTARLRPDESNPQS
jgi:hypothetical protein